MTETLKIMSFNIHGGRALDGKRDLSRVFELMETNEIDIGVFQEMETRISRRGSRLDVDILAGSNRPYRLEGQSMSASDGWYGNLIVSRFPIIRSWVHNLETSSYYEPRNAVDALIDSPIGPIRIIGTHLSLSISERRSEATNLIRLIKSVEHQDICPMLLMGDMNEWQIPSKLLKFLDTHLIPIPCQATFPSIFPVFRLDRVWYEPHGLKIKAARLLDQRVRKLSDHLPVITEIELP